MSLDVWLKVETVQKQPAGKRIFVREGGSTRELSREKWDRRNPGMEPVVLAVDESESNEVYSGNITHNLTRMADAAGVYRHLWKPEELGIALAADLIEPLTEGLDKLKADPSTFKALNPNNGWGSYDGLVTFVENYLDACRQWPHATIHTWR